MIDHVHYGMADARLDTRARIRALRIDRESPQPCPVPFSRQSFLGLQWKSLSFTLPLLIPT